MLVGGCAPAKYPADFRVLPSRVELRTDTAVRVVLDALMEVGGCCGGSFRNLYLLPRSALPFFVFPILVTVPRYKQYALCFSAGALTVLASVFSVNAIFDPQADFLYLTGCGTRPVSRIDNSVDAKFKIGVLKSLREDSIDAAVFGSSRAFRINPECAGFREFGDRTYNLAIQGSRLPSIEAMIKVARQNTPGLVGIVALDFYSFGRDDGVPLLYVDSGRKLQAGWDAVLRLLDIRTLKDSSSLMIGTDRKPRHLLMVNGRDIMNRSPEEVANIGAYLESYSKKNLKDIDAYAKFEYDPQKFDVLRRLSKEGPVIFFLNPESKWYLKPLRNSQIWPVYERWKRELAEFGPVLDFSGCSEITDNPAMYFDEHHYLERAGDLIMEDVANFQFRRNLKWGKILGND